MPTKIFSDVVDQIKEFTFNYPMLKLPFKHVKGNNFLDDNGYEFKMSVEGAGYLHERIKTTPYRWFTENARNSQWARIVHHVNSSLPAGTRLQAAEINGKVEGFMRSYAIVNHKDIVRMIVQNRLDNDVVHASLDQRALRVYVRVHLSSTIPTVDGGRQPAEVRLMVENGHTGHVAFRFLATISSGAYERRFVPIANSRIRHFAGSVAAGNSRITYVMEQIANMKLLDRMAGQKASAAVLWMRANIKLTLRQERLLVAIEHDPDFLSMTFLDLFERLGEMTTTAGYLNTVKGLLDPYMKENIR